MNIFLSHPFLSEEPERQLPLLEGMSFSVNSRASDCDVWIVHEDLPEKQRIMHARFTILITAEPPMQRRYPREYWRQFDLVISAHRPVQGMSVLNWQQCYPWHIGWSKVSGKASDNPAANYRSLRSAPPPYKERLISVICSSESRLPGHQKRLRFVRKLKSVMGSNIDWYGRGIAPLVDKWDGLAPYAFHLCLENSVIKDYWTEKFADAVLASCFPIYWGAPNISEYFDPLGFEVINLDDSDHAIERIVKITSRAIGEASLRAMSENRRRILDEYNYASLVRSQQDRIERVSRKRVTIFSQSKYRGYSYLFYEKAKRLPYRLRHALAEWSQK